MVKSLTSPTARDREISVIVPLKALAQAKARLAPELTIDERRALMAAMAADVLAMLSRVPTVRQVFAVTADRTLARLAHEAGATVIADEGDLNAAVAAGLRAARSTGTPFAAVLPADVPLVTSEELGRLFESFLEDATLRGLGLVGLVPCKANDGTNLLVLSADAPLKPAYGPGSFRAHLGQAKGADRPVLVMTSDALALDIDTPADLVALRQAGAQAGPSVAEFLGHGVGDRISPAEARGLAELPLSELVARAGKVRDRHFGNTVTFSKKVFLPLTHLCRDTCHYCVFAKAPREMDSLYMSEAEAVGLAREGAKLGCKEALFTLGEKPELRYNAARAWLEERGFASTIHYVAHVAQAVLKETGLLPHINAGTMTPDEIALLRKVAPSMGIMLETSSARLSEKGGPHFGSPDKVPAVRLATIADAGAARVPLTTGILIGIGETREERLESLFAIRDLHDAHGHIQEVIVQNFVPKDRTKMAATAAAEIDDLVWTVAMARLIFRGRISVQAPPNLNDGHLPRLVEAGIDDWGGVSPLTPDHVNPDQPWPHLETLREETARAGKVLTERLTIYPSFALAAESWVDPAVRPQVLRAMDAGGLAREDDWLTGRSVHFPPAATPRATVRPNRAVREIVDELAARGAEHVGAAEIAQLFAARGDDFHLICQTADEVRKKVVGDTVTYVVNRNINYTNMCTYRCAFCAFSKGSRKTPGAEAAYLLPLEEIVSRSVEAATRGGTEVCLQGGIHPEFTGETYLAIARSVREALPDMHIHAFSPLEVTHGAETLGLSLRAFLSELKAAGLNTLPGTAAEILHDPVRAIICPDKITTRQWRDVIETAHEVGLPSTSTIMFGHVETALDWALHLLEIRAVQKRTGGLSEFVPLPFVAQEAPMFLKGKARLGPTARESVLMHAIARLVLHPLVPNIQTSWVKMGREGAAAALRAGANDIGGTLMNESITRAAGALHGQEMTAEDLSAIIRGLGRVPRQRTTLYGEPKDYRPAGRPAELATIEYVQ